MPASHHLSLNNGSLRLLNAMLGSMGWYTETAEAYRAGQILEDPAIDAMRATDTFKDAEPPAEWRDFSRTLTLTERQRETGKKCITFYSSKGGLPPGRYTSLLMREFGLAPED